jgi:intracellular sulfur oxidation DsrE/DsrF family protein
MLSRLPVLLASLLLLTGVARAASDPLEALLARPAAPPGVVFEIVDRDPRALEVALPWVKRAAQRLRQRFPTLPMALVTHGQEMFALQTTALEAHPAVHRLAASLARDDGIPVHVCETYAGWRGLAVEDFPDFVDVAPAGPAQVRSYQALDYVRLLVPQAAVLRPR